MNKIAKIVVVIALILLLVLALVQLFQIKSSLEYKKLRSNLHRKSDELSSKKLGFITVVTTHSYTIGAVALIHSCRRFSDLPFILLHTDSLPEEDVTFLELEGYNCRNISKEVSRIKLPKQIGKIARGRMVETFAKLTIWTQDNFDILTYLDSDIILNKDPMLLMAKYTKGKVAAVKGRPLFNSGVMVFKPDRSEFDAMLIKIKDRTWTRSNIGYGDQEFLSWYWKGRWIRLDRICNCITTFHFVNDRIVTHFTGPIKPWNKKLPWFYSIFEFFGTMKPSLWNMYLR